MPRPAAFELERQGAISPETIAQQGPVGLARPRNAGGPKRRFKVGVAAWLLISGLALVLLAFFLIG
ncbi:hypothetical protein ACFQT0_22240 [Hymenobacter humi]|uniref:Uncharacterized protein n=1 Tax=Hymenobacter humi TaxID=1411620 RepID=A0ABW2UBE7_9BACT